MKPTITSYVRLSKEHYIVDDQTVSFFQEASDDNWLKQLYKHIQPEYPKFYKMDQLSQAAFLAVELWKQNRLALQESLPTEVGLVFANRETSSVTDQLFIDSYTQTANASPSLFVYTLPSILLGELCIRNKWYGENIFAVFPKFALDFFQMNAAIVLDEGVEVVLCGWVNVSDAATEVLVFSYELAEEEKEWKNLEI